MRLAFRWWIPLNVPFNILCVGGCRSELIKTFNSNLFKRREWKSQEGNHISKLTSFLFMHVLFWVYIWLANICSAFVCKNKNSFGISSFLWLFITPNKADHGAPGLLRDQAALSLIEFNHSLFLRASLQDSFLSKLQRKSVVSVPTWLT